MQGNRGTNFPKPETILGLLILLVFVRPLLMATKEGATMAWPEFAVWGAISLLLLSMLVAVRARKAGGGENAPFQFRRLLFAWRIQLSFCAAFVCLLALALLTR
jgi:hypothetical protein